MPDKWPSDMAIPWENVGAAVERLFGLDLQGKRMPDLKRALKGAAHELGHADIETCAQLLLSENLDGPSMEVLASHLTVGETYFLRDEDTFAALSTRILPELIAARRRAGDLRLRIWSAACCTGEEIHSVGILLRQLLPDIADWEITLLGSDVNPRFLRKAAEGVYRQWSFRGTPLEFRARYFRRLSGGRYSLLPAIRSMATFAVLNLADEAIMAGVSNSAFDLILCRNVLMYFTPAQASKVVGVLHGALHEDGWLAVAPCEASQVLFARFRPAHCDGAIFYRKGAAQIRRPATKGACALPAAPVMQVSQVNAAASRAIRRPLPSISKSVAPSGKAGKAALPAEAFATRARALADQRRTDEALTWCDRWISARKLDPSAHYLRGMILSETGDVSGACAAFERSLYLAPDGVMASLALAGVERTRGRAGHAARHYRNILASLERLPLEGGVEHAEGVTVRQLTALVQDLMAVGKGT
ncbi:MAG TPA: CheR family methyltransferase [Rhodanobacter sp.]|nr:CheR family methyltransferase [Rhodanobacter sp.]